MFKKILACLMLGAAVFVSFPELNMNVAEAYRFSPLEGSNTVDVVYSDDKKSITWLQVDKSTVEVTGRDEAKVNVKLCIYRGKYVYEKDWARFKVIWRGGFLTQNLTSDWHLDTDLGLALAQYMNDRY